MDIHFAHKIWNELSIDEFHDLLKLRIDIFVVEQDCAYPELDGLDKRAIHFLATQNDIIVGTARLFEPGVKQAEAVLGRLCVSKSYRGAGVAKGLIDARLTYLQEHFPKDNVFTSAQSYREKTYHALGFETVSDEYVEDGIPHFDMILRRGSNA
tara:strand:- start:60 stop:521 length:462 start_codon:yes stop_codon:yes gene_type:complete